MFVCCLVAVHPSADTPRPSGTFNQPGVKHAEGQMRRNLYPSGAEVTLRRSLALVSSAQRPASVSLRTTVSVLQFAISVVLCL